MDYKERHLEEPLTAWEKAMEVTSIGGLLIAMLVLLRSWALVPDSVPILFSGSGDVTMWGPKGAVIVLWASAILLYFALSMISRQPGLWRLPWEITKENAREQYRLVRTMVTTLKAGSLAALVYLQWAMISIALGRAGRLGHGFCLLR